METTPQKNVPYCASRSPEGQPKTTMIKRKKQVTFAEEPYMTEVHPMVVWSHDYQAARKGPWEQYALDRYRYQSRIKDVEKSISYIFHPKHRQEIYDQLFA